MSFHGSYRKQDVEFLLTPIQLESEPDLVQKERLIQSGARHYSEMLTPEKLPSPFYMKLFATALQRNAKRMATDCLALARDLSRSRDGEIVLLSLARAGTPVGAVVKHLLVRWFKRDCSHYSISIIRDRGIDGVALDYVRTRHADAAIAFVDGWTGKGVITRELKIAVSAYNAHRGASLRDELYVLSDLCGVAHHAATYDDYLIPSAILNSTVSGLVSRSILNSGIREDQFHGCVYFEEFSHSDVSVKFVETIVVLALQQASNTAYESVGSESGLRDERQSTSMRCMELMCARYGIEDRNLVKPGIGEATRVLLRRLPDLLVVRDPEHEDVRHLLRLAQEKDVRIEIDRALPYQAVSLIRRMKDGD